MQYNGKIENAVRDFFEELDWNYEINEENGRTADIKLPIWHRDVIDPDQLYYIEGDIIRYSFTIGTDGFRIEAWYPWSAKKRKRKRLLELIEDLNKEHPNYKFIYDEKNFKTGFTYEVVCADKAVNAEMIDEEFKFVYGTVIKNSESIKTLLTR